MFLQQLIESLRSYDHLLFQKINSDWSNPLFDLYFPNITDLHQNHYAQIAVAAMILIWIFLQRARALKGLLVLILAVGLSDIVAFRAIKHFVDRPRPEAAGLQVQLRTHSHSGSSFPSNHASNIFAAATIVTYMYPQFYLLSFFIACSIAYSRVYVGVHFPSDVLFGAFLGYLIAKFIWSMLGHWVDRLDYSESESRSRFYITRARDEEARGRRRR